MSDDPNRHRPLLQLLVRLLGIFFVIDGCTGLLGHGIDCIDQWRGSRRYDTAFTGAYALGWTVASAFAVVAGLTLIFASKVALDAIFHERLTEPSSDAGT